MYNTRNKYKKKEKYLLEFKSTFVGNRSIILDYYFVIQPLDV